MLPFQLDALVQTALLEDAPWGDASAVLFKDDAQNIHARLVARQNGVFCGSTIWQRTFHIIDPTVVCTLHIVDGATFSPGQVLASVHGNARAILRAERVALNFVQRMTGIATLTAHYVRAVAHTHARIADTRKTTPGLRILERAAVRAGGGSNHRYCLSDAVMIKDNHWAAMGCTSLAERTAALQLLRQQIGHTMSIVVEVDTLAELPAILAADVDVILLDNFTIADLQTAVDQIQRRAVVEASGGIQLSRVAEVAQTGVDVISVGALTHGITAIDLGLDMDAYPCK